MVLVGLIMSIGGSWYLTRASVAENAADICELKEASIVARAVLQKGIDDNSLEISQITRTQSEMNADLSAIKADIRWICITLEDISEDLNDR